MPLKYEGIEREKYEESMVVVSYAIRDPSCEIRLVLKMLRQ
jgi:hypothetical protein